MLAAAELASAAGATVPESDLLDRLWHSRPARLVWAAATALLVAANVATIGPRRVGWPPSARRVPSPASAGSLESELGSLAGVAVRPGSVVRGPSWALLGGRLPARPDVATAADGWDQELDRLVTGGPRRRRAP